ncbi:MAG: hypothetical protein J6Q59_06745 [Paludibacteraceae bacterium]|nr:hypothetical protein [Paludibacteraceae bacterium]
MKKIIFLLLSLLIGSLFSSCNTTKRAEKRIYNIVENHQELIQKDTVKIDTTFVITPEQDSFEFNPDTISDKTVVKTDHGKFIITNLPARGFKIDYFPDSVDIHFRDEKIYDKIIIEQPKEKWRDILFAIIIAFVGLLFLKMFFERLMK